MNRQACERYAEAHRAEQAIVAECQRWEVERRELAEARDTEAETIQGDLNAFERALRAGADCIVAWGVVLRTHQRLVRCTQRYRDHMLLAEPLLVRLKKAKEASCQAWQPIGAEWGAVAKAQLAADVDTTMGVSFSGSSFNSRRTGMSIDEWPSAAIDEKVIRIHVHAEPDPSITATLSTS